MCAAELNILTVYYFAKEAVHLVINICIVCTCSIHIHSFIYYKHSHQGGLSPSWTI